MNYCAILNIDFADAGFFQSEAIVVREDAAFANQETVRRYELGQSLGDGAW